MTQQVAARPRESLESASKRILSGLAGLALAFAGQSVIGANTGIAVLLMLGGIAAIAYALPYWGADPWRLGLERALAFDRFTLFFAGGAVAFAALGLVLFPRNIGNFAWIAYGTSLLFATVVAVQINKGMVDPLPKVGRGLIVGIAVLTVLAFVVRVVAVDRLPEGVWFDEAIFGLAAKQVLADPSYRPVFFVEFPQPAMVFYPYALGALIFGPGPVGMRVMTALAGAAAVPAIFLLGRRLTGSPRVGLVAAVLITFMSWHILLSRFPTSTAIFSLSLELFALWCLCRGIQRRSTGDFLLAGVLLGLDLNFYSSARAFWIVPLAVVLWLAFTRWTLWPILVRGTLAMTVGALLAAGPLLQFAIMQPDAFNRRLSQVSVLPEIEAANSVQPLINNITKHIGMFNIAGDKNGRHNLPGDPMLEAPVAALFVLGVGLSLARVTHPSSILLLTWLVVALAPGILSITVEAPQGLRAMGASAVAALLAALPLAGLWDRATRAPWGVFGRPTPDSDTGYSFLQGWPAPISPRWHGPSGSDIARGAVVPVTVLVVIGLAGGLGLHKYFVRWATNAEAWAAHSTGETIVGRALAKVPPDSIVVMSQEFADLPAPTRLVAPNAPAGIRFDASTQLPVIAGDQSVVFFFDEREDAAVEMVRRYYPRAAYSETRGPNATRPTVRTITVTPEDAAAVRGLDVAYTRNGSDRPSTARRELSAVFDPFEVLNGPGVAEVQGAIHVPEYGTYILQSIGKAAGTVWLDGKELANISNGVPVQLARGLHSLRMTIPATSQGETFALQWRNDSQSLQSIPIDRLYAQPVSPTGLTGKYYPNERFSGDPAFARVDLTIGSYIHLVPLPRPYSVEWTGSLVVPVTGNYRIATESVSTSKVYIDGQLIIDNQVSGRTVEAAVQLTQGPHDIRVQFVDAEGYSKVYLYWTPPGGQKVIIPSGALRPYTVDSSVEAAPPPVVRVARGVVSFNARPPAGLRSFEVVDIGPVRNPRDAAFGPDSTLYVIDQGNQRIVVQPVGGAATSFALNGITDPTGIVVATDGTISVIDAESGLISQFDPRGQQIRQIGQAAGFYRPRGLAIDAANNLYVADTGRNRVVVFNPNGEVVKIVGGEKGGSPGQMLEPTDVAPLLDGSLMVLDTGNKRLQWFDSGGRYQAEWPIGFSVPLDGPHIALDAMGRPVVTYPEAKRLVRYDIENGESAVFEGPFTLPVGIVANTAGELFVIDPHASRLARVTLD